MAKPSTIEAQKLGIVKPLDPQPGAFRLEIDEFVQKPDVLNLFLLALESLQDNEQLKKFKELGDDATDKDKEKYWWSFFSIGGIHGWPTQNWAHKHKSSSKPGAGYCEHSSLLFPTWHRPYMFMLEQAIFNKMYEIAGRFPENLQQRYFNAVQTFRLPYWDPWMPRNEANHTRNWAGLFGLPAILKAQEVFVRRPKRPDVLEGIENPLYRYKVPSNADLPKDAQIPWQSLKSGYPAALNQTTIRSPSGMETGRSNDTVLDFKIRSQAVTQNESLTQLLTEMADTKSGWEVFANRKYSWDKGVSLESWHDNMHALIGSGRGAAGNMSNTRIAGFDPIFWLHHCNIDRIFALYQALHPNHYVPEKGPPKEEYQNLHYPLKPFYKSSNHDDFWTSVEAKDWTQCAFAVPGTKLPDTDGDNEKLRHTVATYLHNNYYWISQRSKPDTGLDFPKNMDFVEALIGEPIVRHAPKNLSIKAIVPEKSAALVRTVLPTVAAIEPMSERKPLVVNQVMANDPSAFPAGAVVGKTQRTWDVRLTVRKFAFNDSFNINFFLGGVNDNEPAGFLLFDNQIGFSGVFASTSYAACERCDELREQDIRYSDVVPLTTMLVGCLKTNTSPRGAPEHLRTLESLEPDDVKKYLREYLEWRITLVDGTPKSAEDVKAADLQVKVIDRIYHLPTAEHPLGRYEEPTLHTYITQGKDGGYSG